MPRPLRFPPDELARRALPVFWRRGYEATSVDDLLRATGGSRHALYGAFTDKRALLLAALATYVETVVDPAFGPVERPGAGLDEVEAYFERQIAAAEAAGRFPGDGCLLANLANEATARDPAVAAVVSAHLARLRAGFANALAGAAPRVPAAEREAWAALSATFAQGLWSAARLAPDAADLRRQVAAFLALVRAGIAGR